MDINLLAKAINKRIKVLEYLAARNDDTHYTAAANELESLLLMLGTLESRGEDAFECNYFAY